MGTIITVLVILLLTFGLNIIIIQSNNLIFMLFKKPMIWIGFMGLLSFMYFFIGSQFDNSFNIIWWSALLAFVLQLPPALKKGDVISEQEKHKFVDDMYREIGIEKGRLKYKIGLIFYLVGGTLGWILSYIQIVSI